MDSGNDVPVSIFHLAISFVINCETQEQIDYYWDHLTEGGDVNAQHMRLAGRINMVYHGRLFLLKLSLWLSDPGKSGLVMSEVHEDEKTGFEQVEKCLFRKRTGWIRTRLWFIELPGQGKRYPVAR